MYAYTWYQWVSFFFAYCFIGWVFESTYVSLKQRHLVNRGFLRLPFLPLYGTGAITMLWVSLPVQNNLLFVYLTGMAAATALEYVTGFAMERLFKMRYWDYSNQFLNLDGYICLSSSITWGFLAILLTEVVHKAVENVIFRLSPATNVALVSVISVLFIADAATSIKQALGLGRMLEAMTRMKAELDEIQQKMISLKACAAQKMTEFREDPIQWAATFMEETEQKFMDFRKDAELRREERIQNQKGAPDLPSLAARLLAVADSRKKIAQHLNFYRKSLLRDNPTASSKQFGEALRELREAMSSKKKKGQE